MKRSEEKTKLSERLRKWLAGRSVFWQFFLLLAVILLLASVTQLYSSVRYTTLLRYNLLYQTETGFRKDCELFSDSLYSTYSVPAAVENSADYANLRRSGLPESAKAVTLRYLQQSMQETLTLIRSAGDAECFLYFPGSDAVCTRSESFPHAADCFERSLRFSDTSPEELLQVLNDTKFSTFLPQQNVEVNGQSRECITLVVRPVGADSVLGVLLPVETVLGYFDVGSLPEDSYFMLNDADGNAVLSYNTGRSGGRCYEFTEPLRGVKCTATVGVPTAWFRTLVRPTRVFSLLLLLVMLVVGLLLCLLFSDLSTLPLRKLLYRYSPGDERKHRNEIRQLADLLASSHLRSEEMTQILSVSLLGRVFSGSVLNREEEESLTAAYPVLAESCRVAIVHTAAPSEEMGQNGVTELLQEHLPPQFACATVNGLETGLLFPDDQDSLLELARVLSGVNSQLNVDGMGVLCGVSAAFGECGAMYAAVRQARFAIPIRESSYLEIYAPEETDEVRPGVFSWLTHERLYQAMMKNDRADTVEFIRTLAADKYAPGDAKEVFYSVRFVVRSTAHELQLPLPEADVMEYHEEMRPKENFLRLEELACTLFDRLHARRENDADAVQESVVAYIHENFRDPDLSAAAVADHFALPQKTVYAAVQAKTSMTFGDYVVAVRMKEAARLLCTTQSGADEVAAACGYPAQSTFYRVFKKYYGESPSRYRSLH